MWFWTVQIRENMKKWCRRASSGRPKIHQKLSEWTLAPNDHQNNEKVVSQDPECLKNGLPRPRKINKSVKQNEWNLLEKNYAITEFSNDFNPTNLSNPSSLQINSQLVARGAGGRGEALGNPPPPQRGTGRAKRALALQLISVWSSGSEGFGRSAPAAGPSQKFI